MRLSRRTIVQLSIATAAVAVQLAAQSASLRPAVPDGLFLNVYLPAQDTMKYFASKMRYAACTKPDAKAYVNGKPVKIFPSGAIAGLQNIPVGQSLLRFTVRSNGDSVSRTFVIDRPEPMIEISDRFRRDPSQPWDDPPRDLTSTEA